MCRIASFGFLNLSYSSVRLWQSARPGSPRGSARATLKLFQDADHSFHVPARTGRKDSEVMAEMADALTGWIPMAISRTVTRY
jgi:hypothetical protein